ncbi:hypothetical protein GCM10010129_82740 [Streptomyces fumigatiscleroticus]|nr:hypothetical protein GCM10010129_82740 [Streptomyces fumigatiscleroticus]
MARDQSALLELLDALKAADADDVVRQALQAVLQALIEAEATAAIGAASHQRTSERTAWRNGHRDRLLTTAAGDIELKIPKLRAGSFFPLLLERRRRVDRALFAVVMEACLHGVSIRAVDELVRAPGADTGIWHIRGVPHLPGPGRRGGPVPRPAAVPHRLPVRVRGRHLLQGQGEPPGGLPGGGDRPGVSADGRREILGFDVGDSEDGAFRTAFLRSLRARGPAGVRLVISDAHTGLVGAVRSVFIGASW